MHLDVSIENHAEILQEIIGFSSNPLVSDLLKQNITVIETLKIHALPRQKGC